MSETEANSPNPDAAAFAINVSHTAKLNLADFQNSVALIRDLSIANQNTHTISALQLRLESIPPFLRPKTWSIDACEPQEKYAIADCDVKLDGALLARLTEAETATIAFTLTAQSGTADEQIVATLERKVELLPRNQWGGLAHLPDLVAAFVQPNEPAIDRLLKLAAEVLRKSGKSAAIDGYAGGAKRAWELASALWSAVAGLGIDYTLPPASFEHRGQKVRSAAQIVDARLGTCLDLTLFFAAALEQAGLHPVIVFTTGHAFAGVWLRQDEFSTVVVDDVCAIRKRLKLKELVLFETTLVTQRPAASFTFATETAATMLSEENSERFELVVDIKRARLQRIKPLSSSDDHVLAMADIAESTMAASFDEAPDFSDAELTPGDPATLTPQDRLARWQRKLLDLSMRNALLNFRGGKKSIRLEAPEPGTLEDALSDGTPIKLLPRPELMDGKDPRSQALHEQRSREDVRKQHALDALRRREVFINAEEKELESRLVDLYRTAKTSMQEGGSNSLFLALGFLTWTRDDQSTKYKAPLILIPVSLNRKSARSGFTISLHGDEPRFNPTLTEMLRQDFALNLGVVDGDLPLDEAGLDVARIWRTVSHAIRDIKGWEVSEDVVLTMFSFAKYLMWVDLTQHTDQLRENSVVRHLIDTPRDPYPSAVDFPDPRRLDTDFPPDKTFCPLQADSSQLSAVMAAIRGKDFVLIGPPGTGKSQTIANLIAQALAEGKRVLFVSEKIAALDVVYRRLRDVGLGEFCLELHSNKARKLDVLGQLQRAWEAQGTPDQEQWREQTVKLGRLRDDLNHYADKLHHKHRNGLTIYKAIGQVVDGEDIASLGFGWNSVAAHSAIELNDLRELVDRLGVNALAVGISQFVAGPFKEIGHSDWSPSWQSALLQAARELAPEAERVQNAATTFQQAAGLPALPSNRPARTALASLAHNLPKAAGQQWGFLFRNDAREVFTRLQKGVELVEQHRAFNQKLTEAWTDSTLSRCQIGLAKLDEYEDLRRQLGQPWSPDIADELEQGLGLIDSIAKAHGQLSVSYDAQINYIDVHQLQREWRQAGQTMWPRSWLRKRAVAQALGAAVGGDSKPDVGADLALHVAIKDLTARVNQITLRTSTEGIWLGLKTQSEHARTALQFQQVLAAAHSRAEWIDEGYQSIESGRCGARIATDLARARTLRRLGAEIEAMASLTSESAGLWAGFDTDSSLLRAAVQFVIEHKAVLQQGTLQGQHHEVAAGKCGEALKRTYQVLAQRAAVETSLTGFEDLYSLCAGTWSGLNTARDAVALAAQFRNQLASSVSGLTGTPTAAASMWQALHHLVTDGNSSLGSSGPIDRAGAHYVKSISAMRPLLDKLAAVAEFSAEAISNWNEVSLEDLIARCQAIVQAEARLHAWCAWRKVRAQALRAGLPSLIEALELGHVAPANAVRTFDTNYCRWWLGAVVEQEPVIRSFVAAEHEKRIGDFRALEKQFTELTKAFIRASMCADLPRSDSVTRNSEWGVLRHEMTKKKQHMPLRELISNIPTALTKLTPCLLMSPLSIAQYLSPKMQPFDIVVFDEASQIPVWDAIGAIARGKQVIMVGDPKQLPPTSFFERGDSSGSDDDSESDLESILDECMGANLPTMNLAWHYRSRHESLIAFSNHHYYGGGLITFPAPVTQDRAVSFHHVRGVYEKGGARINKLEAKSLVTDVVRLLKSPNFIQNKFTVGIVTFNTEQKDLIEDLLDEERRRDPSLEAHFCDTALEPVFVKNLESVQGDERDIMYFSITYGADSSGAVSMNFGPMNRAGGERRLNVAITRAREELRVFSSLKAEQLDLSRTQASGVRDLKNFLEFAERGPRALAEATKGSLGGFESPFEEAVATALSAKGWDIHTQIGASSFRIDLCVVHPDAPGTYLCGVECDGATYHRSATARDRDMLREQVLRGLGWKIVRIWSTDWWIDRKGTLEKVDAQLVELLEQSRAARSMEQQTEDAIHAIVAAAGESQAADPPMPSRIEEPLPMSGQTAEREIDGPQVEGSVDTAVQYADNAAKMPSAAALGFLEADPRAVCEAFEPDAFFEASYDAKLRTMIEYVTAIEGPVLDAVVARRIARAHGWQRTGARIQERVSMLASSFLVSTQDEVGTFFWAEGRGPNIPLAFRSGGEFVRQVDEICMTELHSLAQQVRAAGYGRNDAVTAMARELGLVRLKAATKARLERVLALVDD